MTRSRTALAALALAATWVAIATSSAAAASCAGADLEADGLSEGQLRDSVTCLINEQRLAHGLRPVQVNFTLERAALSHSEEMVADGYFSHTSPQGTTFVDRIKWAGYMRRARAWLVGENLVWGSGEMSSPAAMVEAWMNSPAHRENLLRPRFQQVGVAAVRGTPMSSTDADGITVASEYGFRRKGRKHARKSRRRGHHGEHRHR
jgi:uncharacterized protein YkwD